MSTLSHASSLTKRLERTIGGLLHQGTAIEFSCPCVTLRFIELMNTFSESVISFRGLVVQYLKSLVVK